MPNWFGLPRSRYSVILADPPWYFGDRQTNRPNTYPRMQPKEIRALPVITIAADDAALFLWTTNTHLPVALSVFPAYGFEFRTVAFAWSKVDKSGKPHLGMGRYSRQSVELCLLGVRGRLPVASHSVRQLIQSVPGEHSAKPEEARRRIEQLYGDVSRCELFACDHDVGWDAWGPLSHREPVVSESVTTAA